MQNEICKKCHQEYQAKFPGQAFDIKCRGIYDTEFFEKKRQQMEDAGEPMLLEDVREVYDPAFWGERHIVARNSDSEYKPFVPRWYQREAWYAPHHARLIDGAVVWARRFQSTHLFRRLTVGQLWPI